MVLWIRRGPDTALRIGVVTSRKVGGAVARNLARRRMRALWRQHRADLRGDVDVVLVSRASLPGAPWAAVVDDFLGVIRKAGLHA